MKSLLFLALFGLVAVGCSDDAPTATEEKETELIDVGQQTGGDEDVVVTTDLKDGYQDYVKNLDTLDVYANMIEVNSTNTSFMQGDTLVANVDVPSAKTFSSKLGYDFYIDENEVSQKDYFAIMGDSTKYPPSYGTDGSWKSATQPVGSISLYKALLFCNKRSEFKGLDPIYTITGDEDAFTVAIDYSKTGYALPTSTEWEYVAKTIVIADDVDEAYKASKYVVSSGDEPLSAKEIEALNGFTAYFGNVREICLSNIDVYETDSTLNKGITTFNSSEKDKYVLMGGSYDTGLSKVDPSIRDGIGVYATTREDAGLRCVIRVGTVDPESKLAYVPFYEDQLVIDTTVTIDTSYTFDTTDVGPPAVIDTTMVLDTTTVIDSSMVEVQVY